MSRSDKDDSLPPLDLHQQGTPSFASLLAHVRAPLNFIHKKCLIYLWSNILWPFRPVWNLTGTRALYRTAASPETRVSKKRAWNSNMIRENYAQWRYFCDVETTMAEITYSNNQPLKCSFVKRLKRGHLCVHLCVKILMLRKCKWKVWRKKQNITFRQPNWKVMGKWGGEVLKTVAFNNWVKVNGTWIIFFSGFFLEDSSCHQ